MKEGTGVTPTLLQNLADALPWGIGIGGIHREQLVDPVLAGGPALGVDIGEGAPSVDGKVQFGVGGAVVAAPFLIGRERRRKKEKME